MPLLDIDDYYRKLANSEGFTEEELVSVLNELAHFRVATAYLASCHAATAESLPKSASASARRRHSALCSNAAQLLNGDGACIRYAVNFDDTRKRCLEAADKTSLKPVS